ncbi:hypothetical protein EIN_410720 [Entamoeba invadens IP1]|uniref:Uncharacterized protein n=1 Tax=Entamoeba invadens IP1 TaxID=370355 RepID=A0A0A1U6Y2_ENTIV|nr:hypothetical protein EIN_410720 [Entamoeba invadens IP1]ELP87729.1 hypothetical protein EIN_410720 [Entamoeba invadens IP1]|eukprot:XP_004254500.1 hypothetical protein EIN_410720 [Entamoeba invadens IP1]
MSQTTQKQILAKFQSITKGVQSIVFTQQTATIGRGQFNITSNLVSSSHLVVNVKQTGKDVVCVVVDKSQNGTWVNNQRIANNEETVLAMYDLVTLLNPTTALAVSFLYLDMTEVENNEQCKQFLDKYQIMKYIGSGGFGRVFHGRNKKTKVECAIKIIKCKRKKLLNEGEITLGLDNPNIIKTYDVFAYDDYIIMIMEYARGGSLGDIIKAKPVLDIDIVKKIIVQVLNALLYLHQHKTVHRDIKPDNVLYTAEKTYMKLTDFGMAKYISKDQYATTLCGTPGYIAPEIVERMENTSYYKNEVMEINKLKDQKEKVKRAMELKQKLKYNAFKSDVWSCGVMAYRIAVGKGPFDKDGKPDMKALINGMIDKNVEYNALPEEFRDLIENMIVVDPLKRFSVEECLGHEFFGLKHQRAEEQ